MLVAGGAGGALNAADNDLFTDICLFAMKAMHAEVLGIQEQSLSGIIIGQPMSPNLFGDCARILAQISRDVFERLAVV